MNFTTNGGEIKYLPHKNFNSKILEDDMDVQKVYYGKCALYIKKIYTTREKGNKKVLFKSFTPRYKKTNLWYFDISICL